MVAGDDSGTAFEAALRKAIDRKTKPVGALGRIEGLAADLARARGSLAPRLESCELTIFAADRLAASITFLLSDDGVNVNGQNLASDGGWSAA